MYYVYNPRDIARATKAGLIKLLTDISNLLSLSVFFSSSSFSMIVRIILAVISQNNDYRVT